MATEVDSACGAILEELMRQGELDNTYFIIFTTDNGNFHSEHGLADKWYPRQESVQRTPLIICDPRMKHKGTTNDAFTLNIDLPPTILGVAGIAPPDKYMGQDMSQLYLKEFANDEWRK
jgi:arylsulfatase A-like enzyme